MATAPHARIARVAAAPSLILRRQADDLGPIESLLHVALAEVPRSLGRSQDRRRSG